MENRKKQALSVEQMQKLQSLGVDTSGASAVWQRGSATKHEWTLRFVGYMDNHLHDRVFAFTLQDIIHLLPARIDRFDLYIDKDSVEYIDLHSDGKNGDVLIGFTVATCGSLIDAAYMMLEWVVVQKVRTLTKILDLSKSPIVNKEEMELFKSQIKEKEAQTKEFFDNLLLFGKVVCKNEEKTEIRKKIEDIIIKEHPFIEKDELDRNESFTIMGLDSLDKTELMMEIEREFNISIPDDLFDVIDTIGDAVNVVYKLKKENRDETDSI